MTYKCISADGHIDLSWLPPDVFIRNASASARDYMPRVVDGPDGPSWKNEKGKSFGLVCGMGSAGRKYVRGKSARADRMADEGVFGDAARASRRLSDPHQRVKDQDLDGVEAEVLYGILGAVLRIDDPKAAAEATRIYNDWLADFCKAYPQRLVGLGLIPGNDIGAAVAEAKRLIGMGIRGVEMSLSSNTVPLFEHRWDALWSVLSEATVPIHFHITPPIWPADPPHWSAKDARASQAVLISKAPLSAADILMSVMYGGAFARNPGLHVVFGESGLSWIPYVLDRMDYEWEEQYKDLDLKMKPSEYWKRQCKATFQYDAIGMRLIDIMGEDSVMWGADFPHPDGVWPDSRHYIDKQFGGLPDSLRRKIVCDTAAKLYKLD